MVHFLRKILLLPFTLIYGFVVILRNKAFDWGIMKAHSYDFPVVCVGNLSVGGTGKTPMIEYLVRLLADDFKVATLSRGYKRKSKGFYLLNGDESAEQTGDEPLQFKKKFPEIQVAVDEERKRGIAELRALGSSPEVILLDDAFQHRKVVPGFTILLTTYDNLYASDWLLPSGNLREPRSGAKRADLVVVTKCPANLSLPKRERIKKQLKFTNPKHVFFSTISYADKVRNEASKRKITALPKSFCLVTGIAKPAPLLKFLKDSNLEFVHRKYPDHHNFSKAEIEELEQEDFILTTEKDFMRLKGVLSAQKLFYLPIQQEFIARQSDFDDFLLNYLKNKKD